VSEFQPLVIDEAAVGAVCSCMRCKAERYDAISKLNRHRAGIIERCMDMLGDVPGQSLEDRLTKLQGWYLEMQFVVGDLKHKLEVAQAVNRLTSDHVGEQKLP
jgi:hypothetical protein